MKTLVIGKAMVDWYTGTSWEIKNDWYDLIDDERSEKKRINGYDGFRNKDNSIFVGIGEQMHRDLGVRVAHKMVQVSGAYAHETCIGIGAMDRTSKCTRLDIQMTIDQRTPLFDVLRRWREKGRKGNFLESDGGMTVYLGAWGSDRFCRIYEKGDDLLRFEICYHRQYADPSYSYLFLADDDKRDSILTNWMRYEVMRVGDPAIMQLFMPHLSGNEVKPPRTAKRPSTDTEKWIRRVCIPALFKYANSHDCDPYIIDHIQNILNEVSK